MKPAQHVGIQMTLGETDATYVYRLDCRAFQANQQTGI